MSFFIKSKQVNGFKRSKHSVDKRKKRKPDVKNSKNDEITSSEDEEADNEPADDSSEDENETAQEKKLRLAKLYLEEIEKEEKARLESGEVDQSLISKRLKEDYLKEAGKLRLTVAEKFKDVDTSNVKILKCREQRNSITCMCITSDDKYVFVGSKDGVVIKYSLEENKKVGVIPFVKNNSEVVTGHSSKILSISVSTDNKFITTADESNDIYIWDPCTLKFVKKLSGHKKAVLGLCFKKDSHTLYSCSRDRTAKVWNLDEMAYVETLFGHQDIVTSIDTLYKDRVVTSGGRDLRIWKITEETQLIFNGHLGNIDNVKLINEENFISSGDDGQLCVWSIMRKKPLCVIQNAHGIDVTNQQPHWISSVTSLVNTDLVASGSHDGFVKLWKLENNFKFAKLLMKIPVEGFINCLGFTSDGSRLIVAVSKEHKLGRWTTIKSVKNCVMIVPFIKD